MNPPRGNGGSADAARTTQHPSTTCGSVSCRRPISKRLQVRPWQWSVASPYLFSLCGTAAARQRVTATNSTGAVEEDGEDRWWAVGNQQRPKDSAADQAKVQHQSTSKPSPRSTIGKVSVSRASATRQPPAADRGAAGWAREGRASSSSAAGGTGSVRRGEARRGATTGEGWDKKDQSVFRGTASGTADRRTSGQAGRPPLRGSGRRAVSRSTDTFDAFRPRRISNKRRTTQALFGSEASGLGGAGIPLWGQTGAYEKDVRDAAGIGGIFPANALEAEEPEGADEDEEEGEEDLYGDEGMPESFFEDTGEGEAEGAMDDFDDDARFSQLLDTTFGDSDTPRSRTGSGGRTSQQRGGAGADNRRQQPDFVERQQGGAEEGGEEDDEDLNDPKVFGRLLDQQFGVRRPPTAVRPGFRGAKGLRDSASRRPSGAVPAPGLPGGLDPQPSLMKQGKTWKQAGWTVSRGGLRTSQTRPGASQRAHVATYQNQLQGSTPAQQQQRQQQQRQKPWQRPGTWQRFAPRQSDVSDMIAAQLECVAQLLAQELASREAASEQGEGEGGGDPGDVRLLQEQLADLNTQLAKVQGRSSGASMRPADVGLAASGTTRAPGGIPGTSGSSRPTTSSNKVGIQNDHAKLTDAARLAGAAGTTSGRSGSTSDTADTTSGTTGTTFGTTGTAGAGGGTTGAAGHHGGGASGTTAAAATGAEALVGASLDGLMQQLLDAASYVSRLPGRSLRGTAGATEGAAVRRECAVLQQTLTHMRAAGMTVFKGDQATPSAKAIAALNGRIQSCRTLHELAELAEQHHAALAPSNAATALAQWSKLNKTLTLPERIGWSDDEALVLLGNAARRCASAMSNSQLLATLRSLTQVMYTPAPLLAALYTRASRQHAREYQPSQMAGLLWASGLLTARATAFAKSILYRGDAMEKSRGLLDFEPVQEGDDEEQQEAEQEREREDAYVTEDDVPGHMEAWPALHPLLQSFCEWYGGPQARLGRWNSDHITTATVSMAHQALPPGQFLQHASQRLIRGGMVATMPTSELIDMCWSGTRLGGLPHALRMEIVLECEARMADQLRRRRRGSSKALEGEEEQDEEEDEGRTEADVEGAQDGASDEDTALEKVRAESTARRKECMGIAVVVQACGDAAAAHACFEYEGRGKERGMLQAFIALHGDTLMSGDVGANELALVLRALALCRFMDRSFFQRAGYYVTSNDVYNTSSYGALADIAYCFATLGLELPRHRGADPSLSGNSGAHEPDVWLRRAWDSVQAGVLFLTDSPDHLRITFEYISGEALIRLLWASTRLECSILDSVWSLMARLLPGALDVVVPSTLAEFAEALDAWHEEPVPGTWQRLAQRVCVTAWRVPIPELLRSVCAVARHRTEVGDATLRRVFKALEAHMMGPIRPVTPYITPLTFRLRRHEAQAPSAVRRALDDLSTDGLVTLLRACSAAQYRSPRLLRAAVARATALLQAVAPPITPLTLRQLLQAVAECGAVVSVGGQAAASPNEPTVDRGTSRAAVATGVSRGWGASWGRGVADRLLLGGGKGSAGGGAFDQRGMVDAYAKEVQRLTGAPQSKPVWGRALSGRARVGDGRTDAATTSASGRAAPSETARTPSGTAAPRGTACVPSGTAAPSETAASPVTSSEKASGRSEKVVEQGRRLWARFTVAAAAAAERQGADLKLEHLAGVAAALRTLGIRVPASYPPNL